VNETSWLEVDRRLSAKFRIAENPGLLRNAAAFVAHSGDSWFWGIGLGIAWLVGDEITKRWSIHLFAAIVVTALAVMAIKLIVRRERPEGEWGSIYRKNDPHSFPSGHAARAIMLATLVPFIGPSSLIVPLVIWAPLVALARVTMGLHYISDILAGGLLGFVIAFAWQIIFV